MKYHFIYPDINTGFYPGAHHGIAQLVSVLKLDGHKASLSHITRTPTRDRLMSDIRREKPDIIGFTVMSNQLGYVTQWSKWIKSECDIPVVCGGVHAILNPEETLALSGVDMVCAGEGEHAVLDNRFWFKDTDGKAVRCAPYNLIDNLDELPFPDYSLFDNERMMARRGGAFAVICSRGCPHNCYYCSNHALRKQQKGLGRYFRYRSVDNTIEMLSDIAAKYQGIRQFSFADDIFGLSRKWVLEFCEKYPRKMSIPFACNLRAESATRELLVSLRDAGCREIEMGIESGSEELRSKVLNRKMTNQQIRDAFTTARSAGIRTRAYNMVGLPGETADMVRETIALNREVKPDELAVFYYYPFPGTKLYAVCADKGMLSSQNSTNYVAKSVLDLRTIRPQELNKLYNEFCRYALSREFVPYPTLLRLLFGISHVFLRILTLGNEIRLIRKLYTVMSISRKLRRTQ
ncbi:MAG: radical SAM protein [Dehalococcoidales bacterium]|nr:radical SAM protein [Dehalococcoidales bacterium]